MGAVTVVTGGAGGIGLATARILGRERPVIIADVSRERLGEAATELTGHGIECATAVCDITDRRSMAALVEKTLGYGPVHSVVHTAGVSPSMGSAEHIMRINALGTVNIGSAFLTAAGPGFALVNVASLAAHMMPDLLVPRRRFRLALHDENAFMRSMMSVCRLSPARLRPGMAYSISKNFVTWYSADRAAEFGHRDARIVSVSPGSIDTRMGRLEEQSGSGAMAAGSALRRFGRPEEIAEVLAFCAGEKAGYLTGVDILCDGGTSASMSLRDKLAATRFA